ncbi:GID complex subunit containing RING finger motif [Nowakowskiella sp. JEL0407]|nr:GID complex subunit containing RING finger motif [Nowakowskiella sp. JEL0407]
MQSLITSVEEFAKTELTPETAENDCRAIDSMCVKINSLKRKLEVTKFEESLYVQRTKIRLEHLEQLTTVTSIDSEEYRRWTKTRLNRIIVEYMLRNGIFDSAEGLAKEFNINDLVDIELFVHARTIESGIKQRRCTECLQWCSDNRAGLRKMKSTLEFNLRLQEYIELVRLRKLSEAIAYSRKYLIPYSDTMWPEIQQAMGLLAFSPNSMVYSQFFDESRWHQLLHQFQTDHNMLNNLPSEPQLITTLQSGLTALKTLSCYQTEDRSVNCPVCDASTFGELAKNLPNSHHVNSCLVCWESGSIMDESNPCLVLPNGYAYSTNAIKEIAALNGGQVICPRTGAVYTMDQVRKAFIS